MDSAHHPLGLVNQRQRNRIIEYLQWVDESALTRPDLGLNELLNQWEDFISRPIDISTYPPPAYTANEVATLQVVDAAWEAFCKVTPQTITDERVAIGLPQWGKFVAAASEALAVFGHRGKTPEDRLL